MRPIATVRVGPGTCFLCGQNELKMGRKAREHSGPFVIEPFFVDRDGRMWSPSNTQRSFARRGP